MAAIERQIQAELTASNTSQLHPNVSELPSFSSNLPQPLLLADVRRLEDLLNDTDDLPLHVLSPAIDMDRYVDFNDSTDHLRMFTALSYGILRDRNSRAMEQNMAQAHEAQAGLKSAMEDINTMYNTQIVRKRRHVDEINAERQRKQAQFEPVGGYLDMRWQSGIQQLTDLGIFQLEEFQQAPNSASE